ncbi:MAG: LysE family translocator [Pseudomonadota bacterium]
MPQELLSLAGFAFAASITPGPNNLMLMASGTNFGFRRTLPHLSGVALGFALMLILVGVGLGELFERYPVVAETLRLVCLAYLLYLAWRLARTGSRTSETDATPAADSASDPSGASVASGRPLSFLQAAAFQWVNPKAWAMGLTAMSVYLSDNALGSVLLVALVFALVNLPCISSWALLGVNIRRWLHGPRRLRTFNVTMAVLLVASVLPVMFS